MVIQLRLRALLENELRQQQDMPLPQFEENREIYRNLPKKKLAMTSMMAPPIREEIWA